MLLVCHWFHEEVKILGEGPGEGISHVLCHECREQLKAEQTALLAARIPPVQIDKHATA
jgi:hypothetical protein